jgi:2-polyprenyl-6-methoxyphenol hydroxylase-like FAD-dependent oxidoreductase
MYNSRQEEFNMRVAIVGAGPAGLYFAYLWKRQHPEAKIEVFEQNPADATWGFGVVFSDRALEFLRADDPETEEVITRRMETWQDVALCHKGEEIHVDGVGFSAIGRLDFLLMLQERARSAGVEPRYNHTIKSVDELKDFDLIVAADGVNSVVRRSFEGDFKTSLSYLNNKFAWYGTTRRFEALTHTFVESETGAFNAHHYRYSPTMSTFIVECDRDTWLRSSFSEKSPEETKAICESVFAETLRGHSLVSNKSVWRNFPWIWNERWSFRNMVLVGDALRTAHFSIGSGTRLAMEDVIALVKALDAEPGDIRDGLKLYEATRKPVVKKLVKAAKASASWYERFPEYMRLDPLDLAYSYVTRSGRVDKARLRRASPKLMARYDAAHPATQR